jgi:hypothetical protein
MPGIAPMVQTDNATAGIRSRATYGKNGLLYYPEIDTPNNLRRSYTADGQPNGWLLESVSQNFIHGANDFATSGNTVNWVTSGMTKVSATGPDGRTGSAVSLFAATGNATITLPRGAIGTGFRRFSVWLRGVVVTGPVSIQVLNGTWVNVAISTSEWRRFTVTAASGQATCGIRISTNGDLVLAYGPNLVLGTSDSSTSLPENQLSAFSDSLNYFFPIPGNSPTSGVTVFARLESNVRETGIHSNSTGLFFPSVVGSGVVSVNGMDGDVFSSAAFTLGPSGSSSISVEDSANTSLSDNKTTLTVLPSYDCALSIAPGRLIAASSVNETAIIQNPGIKIYDPLYGSGDPPNILVSVSSGSFYIKTLAAWPFAMDASGLNSLLLNFR